MVSLEDLAEEDPHVVAANDTGRTNWLIAIIIHVIIGRDERNFSSGGVGVVVNVVGGGGWVEHVCPVCQFRRPPPACPWLWCSPTHRLSSSASSC